MAIGRLYYTIAALLLCSFYCSSHYEGKYPDRGLKPWSGFGNRYKRAKKDKAEWEERERVNKQKVRAARQAAQQAEQEAEEIAREDGERIARRREEERDPNESRLSTSILGKRRRSSLSSDGDEEMAQDAGDDAEGHGRAAAVELHSASELGDLFQRRVNASPEKFNKHAFESLSWTNNGGGNRPPSPKRLRLDNKIEITYDSTGTPRITSFSAEFSSQHPPTSSSAFPRTDPPRLLLPSHPAKPKLSFSLLHAICRDNDLLLHLVSFLTIPSLVSLYAISKPFHYLFNRHHTAFILANMRTWAPGADKIYPWHCYRSLCVKDPARRQKKRLEGKEDEVRKKWDDLRDVPGLRWLQMVAWRHGVCKDMLILLHATGLRCPAGTLNAIKRMWFLMDLPLNAHRIALIRTHAYISSKTLQLWTCFLLKVDMYFTNPTAPIYPIHHPNQYLHPIHLSGGTPTGVALRKMLLAERGLTPLWRVLRGWNWDPTQPRIPLTRLDMLRLWVRHRYGHPEGTAEEIRKQAVVGVPWYEVGTLDYERVGVSFCNLSDGRKVTLPHRSIAGTGLSESRQQQLLYPHGNKRIVVGNQKPREKLLRPDELLLRECVRRKMAIHKQWLHMMLWGYCDEGGRKWPQWTEAQIVRMNKGLPPDQVERKVEEQTDGRGQTAEQAMTGVTLPSGVGT